MKLTAKVKEVKQEEIVTNFTINSDKYPFLKDAKIGESTSITCECVVTGVRQPDRWEVSDGRMNPKSLIVSVKVKDLKPCKEQKDSEE